jgi:uncharacterized protein YgiM (DUF1202 family)
MGNSRLKRLHKEVVMRVLTRYPRRILWAMCFLLFMLTLVSLPVQAAPTPVTGFNAGQAGGAAATVLVRRASIWAGPGRGFWWIGFLAHNAVVPVLGISADREWWQVSTDSGVGWLWHQDVTTNTGNVPVVNPGTIGRITTGRAVVRGGPGIGARPLAIIPHGTQFYVIGRQPDGSWIQIRYRFGTGWVAASLTDQAGGAAQAAGVPATTAGPRAIINTGALNVRTGPGFGFATIGVLHGGDVVPIVGRNEAGDWLQVRTPFGDGWINIIYVITRDYFGSAPDTSASAAGARTAATFRVLTGTLNVRTGPGVGFPVAYKVNAGTNLAIIGQSRDRGWWLVESALGRGWVNKEFGEATGAINSVPVVE